MHAGMSAYIHNIITQHNTIQHYTTLHYITLHTYNHLHMAYIYIYTQYIHVPSTGPLRCPAWSSRCVLPHPPSAESQRGRPREGNGELLLGGLLPEQIRYLYLFIFVYYLCSPLYLLESTHVYILYNLGEAGQNQFAHLKGAFLGHA